MINIHCTTPIITFHWGSNSDICQQFNYRTLHLKQFHYAMITNIKHRQQIKCGKWQAKTLFLNIEILIVETCN